MKRTLATIIAGASLANIFIYWGTPAAVAWAVAFSGWTAWVFDQISAYQKYGNS